MNDKELNNLVGKIFNNVDDMKIYLRQLQDTMNVDDMLYYHVKSFLIDLDKLDELVVNYSLSRK
tara:strand:+ start:1755 stop:1946 length:192 start_codon:yes stop_codon:yes gene_type:complete